MTTLLLHCLVLAVILGVPNLSAWIDYRYHLSMRHARGR